MNRFLFYYWTCLSPVEMGRKICYICHSVNQLNLADGKLTEKETMDSMTDWENCKGQCGYTQFCLQCMQERDRLSREKKQYERKRTGELCDAWGKDLRSI
jgi:hypothetical protein